MSDPKRKRITSVDEDTFDPVLLDMYWRFVAERQLMYVRRNLAGQPFPWSPDPIMQNEFITNMYRELDPGTDYVKHELLNDFDSNADRIFNVMMYRLMGSQPTTHRLVAATVEEYDKDEFVHAIRTAQLDTSFKAFGDAYRVASYMDMGHETKVENIAELFAKIVLRMPEIVRRVEAAQNVQDVFKVFRGIDGFGEFLAHQITVDLLYGCFGGAVVPFGENQWAQAGPGARAGMWDMIRPDLSPANLLMVMEWLRDNQQQQFTSRGIDFLYLEDRDDEGHLAPRLLSLCNIQSTLCEYHKYIRFWLGHKDTTVRPFDPAKATPWEQLEPKLPVYATWARNHESVQDLLATQPETWLKTPADYAVAGEVVQEAADAPQQPEDVEQADQDVSVSYGPLEAATSFSELTVATPEHSSTTIAVPTPGGGTVNVTINIYVGTK